MIKDYDGMPLQAFALDMWNGTTANLNAFISSTRISYPALKQAGLAGIGSSYACGVDVFFVVDATGVITYRETGWTPTRARNAINAALEGLTTGVDDLPGRGGFQLENPYPNPFNPSSTIAFEIADGRSSVAVDLRIRDLRGRTIKRLDQGYRDSGRHEVRWSGIDESGLSVAAGTYLVSLRIDGDVQSRFLTLVK